MASNDPHGKADDEGVTSAPRKKFQRTEEEDYGYYFYPQRSGSEEVKSFWSSLWGRPEANNFRCEANVIWCLQNNPMVKLMTRALKSHGCEINLRRHISCENRLERVNGGFDPTTNQVVICQNNVTKRSTCCNVLAHEFIHAFDSCRAKVDFEDLHHLACTEQCVKSKALQSVLMVRNVPVEKAMEIVDKVFDKCYNDLEPVGRRPRKNSRNPNRALLEVGGRKVKPHIKAILGTLWATPLARQFNFCGLKGKRSFKDLKCLLRTIQDAVRRLHPGATDSEVKEVVTTWLTGSRDRDNGKREREETKRARQTEDRI